MVGVVSGAKKLPVEEVLGHFNECWAAMGADERVTTFKQLFALIICLSDIEPVTGNNRSFAGAAGQGILVHTWRVPAS